MKKLLCGLLALTSLSAFAQSSFTCQQIYETAMRRDLQKEQRYNDRFNRVGAVYINGEPATLNAGLTVFGFMGIGWTAVAIGVAAPVAIPLVLVGTLTPEVISAIVNAPNKEEKALELLKETSKRLEHFTKKMKKKVSEEITTEEILKITQDGFESGLFCSELPDLMGPAKIKKHVEEKLREKYGEVK